MEERQIFRLKEHELTKQRDIKIIIKETETKTIPYRTKLRRTKVTKILSDEKFIPTKILSKFFLLMSPQMIDYAPILEIIRFFQWTNFFVGRK